MASVNKVILIGHLGADPETRYTGSGSAVTNIRIATSEQWKDKTTGDRQERTEWHSITFFGRLAEIAGEYLKKGHMIYVEGKLRTEEWEKDGVKRYSTKVYADDLKFLSKNERGTNSNEERETERRSQRGSGSKPATQNHTSAPAASADPMLDDDIPF